MLKILKYFMLLLIIFTTSLCYSYENNEVSVVRSDWVKLTKPVSKDKELSREEIEMVVRKAIDELGGMSKFVKPEHK